jgi:hypothetical protein
MVSAVQFKREFPFTGVPMGRRGSEGRYRRWLNPRHGLDLSAGFATGRYGGDYACSILGANGLTGSCGVSTTYIGADARFDLLRTRNGEMVHGSYLSVRAGSRAATPALLGVFLWRPPMAS